MVEWHDGAIDNPRPASDEAVLQAENELRVDLPADFLAVARAHQGAKPHPASIDLPNGFVTDVDCLLHFEDAPFTTNILAARFPVEDVLPKGVIPFARDIGATSSASTTATTTTGRAWRSTGRASGWCRSPPTSPSSSPSCGTELSQKDATMAMGRRAGDLVSVPTSEGAAAAAKTPEHPIRFDGRARP